MNFILSLIGALIIFTFGLILGFWIEQATTPELPNGFKNCDRCGPSFVETHRFWKNELTTKKSSH